jgi:hypothetical protein
LHTSQSEVQSTEVVEMRFGVASTLVSMKSMWHERFGFQHIINGPIAVPEPGMLLILEHFSKKRTEHRRCRDAFWIGFIAAVHEFNVT